MTSSINVTAALKRNALFSFDAKVHSRSTGSDITKLMAYRGGCRLQSELTGKVHTYTRKSEVAYSAVQLPALAPLQWSDRRQLAIAIDAAETRVNSQIVREITVALPRELDLETQIEVMHRWIDYFFVRHGVVASWDLHAKPGNPHVHLLLALREATPDGFGAKVRKWNNKFLIELCRATFAQACNRALRKVAGIDKRMDHRKFSDRRDLAAVVPTIHQGPALPNNQESWWSKKIYNDYVMSLRPTDTGEGDGDGDGTGGGAPRRVCPIVRLEPTSRLVKKGDVDSPPPGSGGAMARPSRRRKKTKDGQVVTGWGEPK